MNMEGLPFTDEIGNEVLNVGGVTLAAGLHSGDYSALLNTSKYLGVKDPTPRNIVAEPFTFEEKVAINGIFYPTTAYSGSETVLPLEGLNPPTNDIWIGCSSRKDGFFNGKIDAVCITRGVARYDGQNFDHGFGNIYTL